jgi:hypothetical protein
MFLLQTRSSGSDLQLHRIGCCLSSFSRPWVALCPAVRTVRVLTPLRHEITKGQCHEEKIDNTLLVLGHSGGVQIMRHVMVIQMIASRG